jgi:hypothetical protein
MNPSTLPNELNTTLTPHSIIHGDACFAYFNKIWGIPGAMLEAGAVDRPHCLVAVHSRLRAAQVISDCRTPWLQNSTLTGRHVHSSRLVIAEHGHVQAGGSAHFSSV